MKTAEQHQLPAAERNMLADLHLSDDQTSGSPVLPAAQIGLARAWLARILLEPDPWIAHVRQLEHFYQARFSTPLTRILTEWQPYIRPDTAVGFRHNQLLPEAEARSLAEKGPDDYPPDKLARLLLNPVALWDVSDLISTFLPDYWLPRMDELGRAYMEKHGCKWKIPGEDDPRFQKKVKASAVSPIEAPQQQVTPTREEKAACGLRLLKQAILDYLAERPQGARSVQVRKALALRSDVEGIAFNSHRVVWSLLGLLIREGRARGEGKGRGRHYYLASQPEVKA